VRVGDSRKAGRIHADVLTINGTTMGQNLKPAKVEDPDVIRSYGKRLKEKAGFCVLTGKPVRLRDHEDKRSPSLMSPAEHGFPRGCRRALPSCHRADAQRMIRFGHAKQAQRTTANNLRPRVPPQPLFIRPGHSGCNW
jgi:2,4-dienoyl-CoA reductase-like NADH-dependent reductase (Old Yellow Enzyme family)